VVHGNRDALRALQEAAARWAVRGRLPLTIALAGALAGGGLYLGNQAYVAAISPTSCPAGCVTNGTLYVSSDLAMQHTENEIAAANARATAGAYYSVVLLDPFTYSTGGTVSQSRMADELRGAYLALAAANATVARKHTGVAIQLLLANEGTSAEEGESKAVGQIENLEGPDRIVAVAGMGLSTANTETAATALSAVSMPMFGAVTTGDQFNGLEYQGFFQIAPDVAAQVRTLVSDLRLASPQPVALISSDQKSDIYSIDLQSDFMTALGYTPPLGEFSYDPATAEQQFAGYATAICTSQNGKHASKATSTSLTVLYAGREATLPALVGQFQQASVCADRTVTIVTGSDSNALPASVTDGSDPPGANVTVVYSDIESVANLSQDFVTGAPPPTSASSAAPCLNQEYDPWEVATYNSVMAATSTVSRAVSAADSRAASPAEPLTAAAVLSKALDMVGSAPYPVPNGTFGFNPNGELRNTAIPVYTDENGTCREKPPRSA
jgi:hypothetical protein